jgi:Tfp pilus assembly protein PilO
LIAVAVAAILLVGAVGWVALISPQHHKVSKLKAQDAAQQQTNSSLQGQISLRTKQAKDVVAQEARIAAIQQQLPANVGLAGYVRALTAAAAKTGVDLQSIAPGAPAAVTVAKPTVAPAPAAAAPSAAPTASANAAVAAAPTPAAQPAAPPVTVVGLNAIPLQLQVAGSYFQIEQFLSQLEGLQRATNVTSVDLAPGGQVVGAAAPPAHPWDVLKTSISLDVFMTTTPLAVPSAQAPTPSPSH